MVTAVVAYAYLLLLRIEVGALRAALAEREAHAGEAA
jgi:hypothetical protein